MGSKYDPNISTFISIFHILIIPIFSVSLTKAQSSSPSIYDLLSTHGLPAGIFPKGISDFSIEPTSGRFELRRTRSCAAQFETDVWYDVTVTGTLSYGLISDLSGIAAQDLFLWFPVNEIRVDIPSSGLIYFDVGIVSKQLSLSFFEIPQDCTVVDDGNVSPSVWLPPPEKIVLFDGHGRRNENPSRKQGKQSFQWHAGVAVS